jgi:small GTP-binding protein
VKTSKSLRGILRQWRSGSRKRKKTEAASIDDDYNLQLARESLRELLEDERVPPQVREGLADDYAQVQAMLDKLEQGHIHIAAFGRVSVGKSATLNAMLGEERFSTSPLHGETKHTQMGVWDEYQSGGVYLIDTPGLNEVDGEQRERLAHEVASRSDLVLFIVDGDLTESEISALRILTQDRRPVLLVLNKADRYTKQDREILMTSLRRHSQGVIEEKNIVCISARPAERLVILVDEDGNETETVRQPKPDVDMLRVRLWELLEAEGETLAALNATLFASSLSDQVGQRILDAKRGLGERVIRTYCAAKGVTVALNPVPLADLAAAVMVDVGMVVHLSKLYGLPLSKSEAGSLIKTIFAQMAVLMGATWLIHLVASVLKVSTGGLSTALTGGAQGAVAYYSTYLVGQAAEHYLAQGKSWGEGGPKQVVRDILDRLDRDSILAQARVDIAERLRSV